MNKGLIALASGTFVLGISEFVMMGILPDVATDLGVSIPQAGRLISIYAIGVCIGAFSLLFLRKLKPKHILMLLSSVMLLGAFMAICSNSYPMLLLARLVEGLPHGAYFGASSIVAVRLAKEGHKASAVAIMSAGMTVANLIGNPFATFLSESISWKMPFVLIMLVSLLVILLIWRWIPNLEALPDTGMKGQFRFLKNLDPWLILATTMLGNGGIFCWYSYISPLLQHQSGFNASIVPLLMIIAGLGMFCGNLVGGRLSDMFKPGRTTFYILVTAVLTLSSVYFVSTVPWLSLLQMFLLCACLFGVSAPEQLMILEHSKGGEMLGGCCIQVAFNFGNAMGAYLGGLPIDAGMTYNHTALMGLPLVVLGGVCIYVFRKKFERNKKAKAA